LPQSSRTSSFCKSCTGLQDSLRIAVVKKWNSVIQALLPDYVSSLPIRRLPIQSCPFRLDRPGRDCPTNWTAVSLCYSSAVQRLNPLLANQFHLNICAWAAQRLRREKHDLCSLCEISGEHPDAQTRSISLTRLQM